VLRSTSPGAETTLVTGVTSTTYGDASAAPGTTYYYEVAGVNSTGAGPVSNQATVTTTATSSHISASIYKSCSYFVYASNCTFNSTSTDVGGTITTYSWSTSGATGTGSTFGYTFTGAGTYTVNLKVADNEGSTGSASTSVTCTWTRSYYSYQLTCS
jgi:hypothetical protein